MTSPTTRARCPDPLRSLPSVLVMPDLRRRLGRVLHELPVGEDEMVALLGIDPLATVRGLRAASAAVFASSREMPTMRGLVRQLGATQAKRLLRLPAAAPSRRHRALQQLWHHAIATAIAARELAERTGLMEPEQAYLVGLLHDLPEWIHRLSPSNDDDRGPTRQPSEWLRYWQLPAPLVSLLLAIEMADRASSTEDPPDAVGLIRAAELLAELADFRHPDSDATPWLDVLRESLPQHELQVASQLHRRVEASLRSFGLAPDVTDREVQNVDGVRFLEPITGQLDQAVLGVLGCSRAERYRAIVTMLTAAAVRFGGYDRAFYAKWQPDSNRLTLRSKADSSARRILDPHVVLGEHEAVVLRRAHESQAPQHLWDDPGLPSTLLQRLSTDELLAVPLNREFATPSFLLLDRSLTMLPIDPPNDLTMAMMLGMTGTLLNQNLLLRRRRQRAQKFSLTDPLTHLFNRRMGIHTLEQAISRTERDKSPLTVLMCDLDHFKRLNDTLGHLQGDAALRATADVLRLTVRKADVVCRYGGEEFLVVLPDTTAAEATVLATRLFTAVQARGEDLALPMTVSIGLTCHRFGDSVETILHRADRALYASKGYGRNRFSADVEDDPDEPPVAGDDDGGPEPPASAG